MKQIKFQLKNKLNVILAPSHKSPVVSVQMWVKTGSADEAKGEEGISHFIEHLVFKGTRKFKVGEIASVVEASGGELNAYTSFDQTVFYVTISKSFSDVALDVVAEMMGHPTFIKDEVDSEREVVCEEIKMGQDSPQRSASQLLFKSVFKKHAYGIPVIGYDKNVRGWSVDKIRKYYQSRYVPSNMALIITGDFDPKEMKQKVIKYYSDFQSFKLKKIKRKKEPIQKKPTFSQVTKKLNETSLQMAWPVPGVKHKDVPALDALAMILGQGETSRLVKALRLDKPLVNSVSAFSYNPIDAGLFAVIAKSVDQDKNEIYESIFRQIENIKNHGPTWQEIKKTIITLSSEQFYSLETVDGIASKVGSDEFYFKDPKAHEKYLKAIQKLTPQAVQKIAKKYLVPQKVNFSILNNQEKDQQLKILKNGQVIWKKILNQKINLNEVKKDKKITIPKISFKSMKSSKESDVEIFKTKNGTEILFKKQLEIPTVSAKIIFGGGSRTESETEQGLTEMLTRIWPTETQFKSEIEVLNVLDECAAGLNSFGGRNTVGLSIDYMKAFEKKIIELTSEVVCSPQFNTDLFNRERSILLKQIQSKKDHPSYLCNRLFMKTMYPDSPLSFEQVGTEETLNTLDIQKVEQHYKKLLSAGNMQVTVVGDFDKKLWIQAVESMEESFISKGKQLKPLQVMSLLENKKSFLENDKEQSHVMIAWRSMTLSDPRRYVLNIIDAVLSGMGGRLFVELREKNSLAYSVAPVKMENLEVGHFGGYIACSPDKVDKAIELFHQEFKKLTTEFISDEELERAKKYLIGQNDIGLQRKSAFCNMIAFDHFYGLDINEHLHIEKIYAGITKEDVKELAQSLFTKNYVVTIVGKNQKT